MQNVLSSSSRNSVVVRIVNFDVDFPLGALTLLVGRQEGQGIKPVKSWVTVCWW